MINIDDLHIQQQILPLFDFTHNEFSKETLISILKEPLSSKEEVLLRQEILKAFIATTGTLKDYSYSRVDLLEVYAFHQQHSAEASSILHSRLRLFLFEKERHRARSRYIQFVLLFHKLQTQYLIRIDLSTFPESYKREIESINELLGSFNLTHYEELIRAQKFRIKHIIELARLVSEKTSKGELAGFWNRYFLFEAYLSISTGIVKHNFSFPSFCETGISFKELYHPLLKHPVTNSFSTYNNVFLLTGPNMSGKSTLLKAIGLSVYFSHIGLAVPALKAEMPFFDSISISIDLNDDILNGYSHFMTEVLNLKKVVVEAVNNKRCFAVFDELFRGTNIDDAIEITATTIKGLATFKSSFFFISTHLQQIKEAEEVKTEKVDTYYIHCEIINDRPGFTYQLKKGWSDLKLGLVLFEKEGLNELLNSSTKNTRGIQ